jgi:hypothetical protein
VSSNSSKQFLQNTLGDLQAELDAASRPESTCLLMHARIHAVTRLTSFLHAQLSAELMRATVPSSSHRYPKPRTNCTLIEKQEFR